MASPARSSCRLYNVKRLIGRRYSDGAVQDDMKHWSFDVFKGPEDMPELRVEHGGIPMKLAPQQVSAMLLRSIKQCAEDFLDEEVAQAVITVPTYFTDSQRAATKDAGEIAGLRVLSIINEPTAAALTYGLQSSRRGHAKVLIFDLGGGTCDVSILDIGPREGSFRTLAVTGDRHLGGEDFNNCLVEHLLQVRSRGGEAATRPPSPQPMQS